MWAIVHLVAVAVLAGVGLVVQLVVYPAFRLVGPAEWAGYHARHTRAITGVVALPWSAQGVSTVALLVAPPSGARPVVVVLAVLAAVTVVATLAVAVPAHDRIATAADRTARDAGVTRLLRSNAARTAAWATSAALTAALLVAAPLPP